MLKSRAFELALLSFFPLVFALTVTKYFWVLPNSAEALNLLAFVLGKTASWSFDQINLASNLALVSRLLPLPIQQSVPFYSLFVTTLTLVIGQLWLYKRAGFAAAVTLGVLVNCSWYFNHLGSQLQPAPTLGLYGLIAVLGFLEKSKKSLFVAGLFAALASLTSCAGFVILIAMLAVMLRQSQPASAYRQLGLGFATGSAISVVLLTALFGPRVWLTLLQTPIHILGDKVETGLNNAVSLYPLLMDRLFLPVFLTLFMSQAAYAHALSRTLLLFSWSFVAAFSAYYLLSPFGGAPSPIALYPAFLLAGIAFSHYLGSLMTPSSTTAKLALVFFSLLFLTVGLRFGLGHNPPELFLPGYFPHLSKGVRIVFNFGVIALVALILSVELKATRARAVTLLLAAAFWTSAYAGGQIRHHFVSNLIPETEFYYNFAGALTKPTSGSVDVFVERWNKSEEPEKLGELNQLFYSTQQNKTFRFVKTADQITATSGRQILTDRPDLVQTKLPQARLALQYEWNGLALSVLDR